MKRIAALMSAVLLVSVFSVAQGRGNGHGRGNPHNNVDDGSDAVSRYVFSRTDRTRIVDCLNGGGSEGLPPGLAKRDRLPPGLERQLQRNGHLPPGLEKKMRPLPRSCEVRLPRLPPDITRVVVGNYVILRDIHDRILDLFEYNRR